MDVAKISSRLEGRSFHIVSCWVHGGVLFVYLGSVRIVLISSSAQNRREKVLEKLPFGESSCKYSRSPFTPPKLMQINSNQRPLWKLHLQTFDFFTAETQSVCQVRKWFNLFRPRGGLNGRDQMVESTCPGGKHRLTRQPRVFHDEVCAFDFPTHPSLKPGCSIFSMSNESNE